VRPVLPLSANTSRQAILSLHHMVDLGSAYVSRGNGVELFHRSAHEPRFLFSSCYKIFLIFWLIREVLNIKLKSTNPSRDSLFLCFFATFYTESYTIIGQYKKIIVSLLERLSNNFVSQYPLFDQFY